MWFPEVPVGWNPEKSRQEHAQAVLALHDEYHFYEKPISWHLAHAYPSSTFVLLFLVLPLIVSGSI